jgi:hypothetical protein
MLTHIASWRQSECSRIGLARISCVSRYQQGKVETRAERELKAGDTDTSRSEAVTIFAGCNEGLDHIGVLDPHQRRITGTVKLFSFVSQKS